MSITAYQVEAVGHDRSGNDFGYVNIMYRYGNKQPCPPPDQCEKLIAMDYENLAVKETTIVG